MNNFDGLRGFSIDPTHGVVMFIKDELITNLGKYHVSTFYQKRDIIIPDAIDTMPYDKNSIICDTAINECFNFNEHTLIKYLTHEDPELRYLVAIYSDKYHHLLKNDKSPKVRAGVCERSTLYHNELHRDPAEIVRLTIAKLNTAFHNIYSTDPSENIRIVVASASVLYHGTLAYDKSANVRLVVLRVNNSFAEIMQTDRVNRVAELAQSIMSNTTNLVSSEHDYTHQEKYSNIVETLVINADNLMFATDLIVAKHSTPLTDLLYLPGMRFPVTDRTIIGGYLNKGGVPLTECKWPIHSVSMFKDIFYYIATINITNGVSYKTNTVLTNMGIRSESLYPEINEDMGVSDIVLNWYPNISNEDMAKVLVNITKFKDLVEPIIKRFPNSLYRVNIETTSFIVLRHDEICTHRYLEVIDKMRQHA